MSSSLGKFCITGNYHSRRRGMEPEDDPAPARGDPSAEALSSREIEVLRLVAAGRTAAEIAGRLAISPRTVQAHVISIYGKLNIATRSALTRYAIAHHL